MTPAWHRMAAARTCRSFGSGSTTYPVDQTLVSGDQAVGHCLVHEFAGAFELCLAEVLALFQDGANPFVVDSVSPASPEQIGESQAKEKIAD